MAIEYYSIVDKVDDIRDLLRGRKDFQYIHQELTDIADCFYLLAQKENKDAYPVEKVDRLIKKYHLGRKWEELNA